MGLQTRRIYVDGELLWLLDLVWSVYVDIGCWSWSNFIVNLNNKCWCWQQFDRLNFAPLRLPCSRVALGYASSNSYASFMLFKLPAYFISRWSWEGKCQLLKASKHEFHWASNETNTNMLLNSFTAISAPLDVYVAQCKQFGVCIASDDFFETSNLPRSSSVRIRRRI